MSSKIPRIISTGLIILILLVTVITIYSISTETQKALKDGVRDKLMAVASATASQIDGDAFSLLSAGEEGTQDFIHIRDQLHQIEQATPDIRFIYTLRKNGDIAEFVVDGDYGYPDNAPMIGQAYPEAEPELFMGFISPSADNEFTTDEWGTVLSGFAPIRDHAGNIVGIVGVDMDSSIVLAELNYLNQILYLIGIIVVISAVVVYIIIERRRGIDEQKVEESEKKYRLLFERAGDAIFLLQAENTNRGDIVAANRAAADMYGYTIDELHGMNITDLYPPYVKTEVLEKSDQILTGTWLHDEVTHRKKDGSEFSVEISIGLLDLGTKKYILAMSRDISDRKKSEKELKTMYEELEARVLERTADLKKAQDAYQQANRQLSLLSSITRHDISNQISIIIGNLWIAKKKSDNPEMKKFILKLESATNQIKEQIEFTRIYQDLGTHEAQWQEPDDILRQVSVPDYITLHTNLNGILVYADPMLGKVFSNLLDNSIRHGQRVTEISVSSKETGEGLTIVWEDNGTGVALDEKERIFVHGVGKNTGFGLFLVREILAITGMTIRETGEPGKGARFEIMVPKGEYRIREARIKP
jgi:PAS domain S-box-containing protein